ncbi:unnamed protein product [Litomosoides sigmodontis]|uniref:Hexosyltransferase n=1 Tax=Litomosoides sigmodontis TaxID=42156 RepID=A0A3P6SSG8_LITSI|nr:unnamed protein product [Litomosoides sigmodontis]
MQHPTSRPVVDDSHDGSQTELLEFASKIFVPLMMLIYSTYRKLRNFSTQQETSALNSSSQRSSSSLAKALEFRYAWHKINQYNEIFQPFMHLIEPSVCTKKKHATMLLYLTVPPDQDGFTIRNLIRNTWATEAKHNDIEVIFSIGIRTEAELYHTSGTDAIFEESLQFQDILMANFVDKWDNLLLKWWSNNYYHSSRCSQIPLMASMDSDAVLFGENLKKFLDNPSNTFDGYLGCTILSKQPIIRDNSDRYYVSELQWPGEVLPDYCSGTMIIENVQACKKISYVMPQLGIHYITGFRIFDVLTGPVAQAAGLKLRNIPGIQPWLPVDDICHPHILVIHSVEAKKLAALSYYRQQCCNEYNKYRKCPFNGTINFNFMSSNSGALV